MSDDEEDKDETPYTWRQFWWDFTHVFSSVADIVEEEKKKIDTMLWNTEYDIKIIERETEWIYDAAGTCMKKKNTEGARQKLLSYAQKLVSLRRMREHAMRLEQYKTSLSGINIQLHMTTSHEHLTWAIASWSKNTNMDHRIENLDRLANSLDKMATLVNEGDIRLEHHNTVVEKTEPMVQVTHNIDSTVSSLLTQLQGEQSDALLKEAPRLAKNNNSRKPPVKKTPAAVRQ